MRKLEKGITLVALIITIVVLLILAVVSIGAIRDSKIIGHATNTSDAWKQAQANEAGYLEGCEEKLEESTGAKVISYVKGVPIPVGFKYVEGDPDTTGLVIESKTDQSQFVWIPVKSTLPEASDEAKVVTGNGNQFDAISDNLVKAGMPANSTSTDFLNQLTNEYKAMKSSVEHYGGFYVGRYELSDNGGKAASVAEVIPANKITWYELYALCKTYKTSSVTGSMIWGCQWNAMMTFIGDKASQKGNVAHGSSNFTTKPYQAGGTDYSTNYKIKEREEGYVKYQDICNNIYDLEGNVSEWTIEAKSYRFLRGGYYDGSYSPKDCNIYGAPTFIDSNYGSRLTLYIEL